MSKNNANKFSPEVRERAVHLVQESHSEHPSLWVAVESIAPKIGCLAQTLLTWVKRHEVDGGQREGVTTSERVRIKSWSGRTESCAAPTTSCARPALFSRRRSSTAS